MSVDFAEAFRALTGHAPFRWQVRLFDQLAQGEIPAACDIPTGLGKTSVMAIWLAALDLRAPRLPRRLIYVVDRRAVVDQATEEAVKIAQRLGGGETANDPDKAAVITALRERLKLSGPLAISTLRGQFADNRAWLDDPSMPSIVVGTVDMIASRLLFSGYNVSRRMRPVQAALIGTDALVVLDEAHLVPPFQALIEQVAAQTAAHAARAAASSAIAPFKLAPMRTMALSATGRRTKGVTFALTPADVAGDETVRRRVNAPKRIKLEDPNGDLAETMAKRAVERSKGGRRVIVFCNSRKVAQDVYDRLEKHLGKGAKRGTNLELIVGARRVREREQLVDSTVFRRFAHKPKEGEATADEAAFLVATSAGEVGVDVDAEHMVCDLVAWERMVQRLGRVNRLGECTDTLVDVFVATPDKEAETPPGTPSIAECREPFDHPSWETDADGRRDASPGALRDLGKNPEFKALTEKATTDEPLRPALTDAHIAAWSMTSLAGHTGRAEVAPWIRGWEEEQDPKTEVLWRKHLPIREGEGFEAAKRELADFLEEAPPHLSEILETETYRMADMLRTRAKALLKRGGKEASPESEAIADEAPIPPLNGSTIVAIVLAPDRKIERLFRLDELGDFDSKRLQFALAHRIVILDARLGGLAGSGLLDPKADKTPATLDEDSDEGGDERLWSDKRLQQSGLGFRVRLVKRGKDADPGWKPVYRRPVKADVDGENDEEWRVEDWVGGGAAERVSALAASSQTIKDHHVCAERCARAIAKRLGLPAILTELLAVAAKNHDWGKARAIWQRYAGNPSFARDPEKYPPLAKFTTRGDPRMLKVGNGTYRHEFGSVHDAIEKKVFDDPDDFTPGLRRLGLNMIATHHGEARPTIFAYDEKHLQDGASRRLAGELLRDFVELQTELGPWGLAWLQALLRAADVMASRGLGADAGASPKSGEAS
jgi:CRISPR-associated endonuclease/helicase Cas3